MNRIIILIVSLGIISMACNKDEKTQLDEDIVLINQYIEAKQLENVQSTESGLHYVVRVQGEEGTPFPVSTDTVTVNYVGRLMNDIVFDQGDDFKTVLMDLVSGFQEGTTKIQVNGEVTMIIPSTLGYGGQSLPGIPSNSVLVFDVKLLKIDRPQ